MTSCLLMNINALFQGFHELFSASCFPGRQRSPEQRELEKIIDQELITPVFQPIVSLSDGAVHGHEALTRVSRAGSIATPDLLFAHAREFGLTAPLERLCRKKSLARAKELGIPGRIFINVCPTILQAGDHERGQTTSLLDELGIQRSRITFELTERTLIEDFVLFKRALSHYRQQGYSIAIDDLGTGYSGLKMLAQLEPDYVKLASFLTAGIDSSATRQALVESLVSFCGKIGATVIAEGIERDEELAYLISAGVNLGQGYLLGKPSATLLPA